MFVAANKLALCEVEWAMPRRSAVAAAVSAANFVRPMRRTGHGQSLGLRKRKSFKLLKLSQNPAMIHLS
jgi:hypothetical protein